MEMEMEPKRKSKRFNLYLAVMAANVGAFSLGSLYNWTSPALPKLSAADSWLPITTTQASWIGSLIGIGSIFGPFIGGVLVDTVGRKGSMILAVLVGLVAWAMLYFTTAVWHIYISRIIGGIGGGIVFTCVPLYIAEIAEDDIRSALGSTLNFFFASGYLIEYIFGPWVSHWNLILISCVAPILFFIMCPFIPESPYYYILKDDIENAHKSLKKLRTGWPKKDIEMELEVIKESVQEAMREKGTLLELVATPTNRKALLLSCGAMTFQQMSGINVVLFYSETIFNLAGDITVGSWVIKSSSSTIVVAVILIIFAGVAMPLTKMYGIRNMLITSAAGMVGFQTITGFWFFVQYQGVDVSSTSWIPLFNLVGYVVTYSLGYGPLPTAVKGEVFPPNVKGISSAVTVGYSWGLSFVITKLFPHINEVCGMFTVFWIFSVSCFLATLFSIYLMIDTRNLSLQEIQDLLNGKRKKKTPEPVKKKKSWFPRKQVLDINTIA
ncbi:facilitated trehalose transporter Tret1-like [Macrosteles quadrilineatus]|uniref:facilitated trehalose transporter Tret1-like n=1 Tax=Macrosteles quadrilineatus TaxID=74068 RepID=UPI0023E19A74|nr:facilitated trehalose transporter Tret1-like [Macrosteles quadrilineatus]XP_054263260.1 facilitated trehalose transporter Tret1-like [Macrosteles quadrilineatus]XP_054263261.1 facilitated trehalose transporter Tret1-like [Macrosteles quadrilineatus]XP_054263772.1 facilitated trehalose transporter Tret1-like [Macrosteles quadrilineatus]